MANGKVEKFNNIIKQIFYIVSIYLDYAKKDIQAVLDCILEVYNYYPNYIGYSFIYLAFGLYFSSLSADFEEYIREPIEHEEMANVADLVHIVIADCKQAC